MQSSIFYFAHFAFILLLFLKSNGTVLMEDIRTAYCSQKPQMEILNSQDVGEKTSAYFTLSGSNYVVTRKGGPRKPTNEVEPNLDEIILQRSSNRYFLGGHLSGHTVKVKEKWPFTGYNQHWIGCPQSLCIGGHLDAANDDRKGGFFLSAVFLCETDNLRPASNLTDAIEIQCQKYFEAAYCGGNGCYLVKVDNDKMNTGKEDSGYLEKICTNETTSAVATTRSRLFAFLESRYCPKDPDGIQQAAEGGHLPPAWHNLDAALVRGDQLHIVRQRTNFKVHVKAIDDGTQLTKVDEVSVFDELFGCQDFDYESSIKVTKEKYRQKMDRLDEHKATNLLLEVLQNLVQNQSNKKKYPAVQAESSLQSSQLWSLLFLLVLLQQYSSSGRRNQITPANRKISSSQLDARIHGFNRWVTVHFEGDFYKTSKRNNPNNRW